jgi:hypothetical protein
MHLTQTQIDAFAAWIRNCGGEVTAPTNGYEILRVVTKTGTHVAYRNKKGNQTWPDELVKMKQSMGESKALKLSARGAFKGKGKSRVEALLERDGNSCWYCGLALHEGYDVGDPRRTSIEEICPQAHGGPAHLSNQVLAHQCCNGLVGNLPVAHKVEVREMLRAAIRKGWMLGDASDAEDGWEFNPERLTRNLGPKVKERFPSVGEDTEVVGKPEVYQAEKGGEVDPVCRISADIEAGATIGPTVE